MSFPRIALLLALIWLPACGKSLERQIQDQVRTSAGARLERDAVKVGQIRESGSYAIAEVDVHTAVKMRREGDHWVMEEVRLGDRRWERVDRILDAIRQSRQEQTRRQMDEITSGIHRYAVDKGQVPQARDFRSLIDVLSPQFLETAIRLDAWWNPYYYEAHGKNHYELRSAGPDGRIGTEDDLVRQ